MNYTMSADNLIQALAYKTPNLDRLDTTVSEAVLEAYHWSWHAGLPYTLFRSADTSGWAYGTEGASRLVRAEEVLVTILPPAYFN